MGYPALRGDEQEFEPFQWRELVCGINGESPLPFFPRRAGRP